MTTTTAGVITMLITSLAFFFAHNFVIKTCAKIRRKQSNPTTGAIIYWILRVVIIVALQWIITRIIYAIFDYSVLAVGYAMPMNAYYWFCMGRDIATSVYAKKASSQTRKKISYGIYAIMTVYHFIANGSAYVRVAPVCTVVSFVALVYASVTFAKSMKKISKYVSGSSSAPTKAATAPRTTYTPTPRPTTTTTPTTPKKTIQEGSYYSTEQGRRYAQENSSIILKLFESLEKSEVVESIKGSNGDVLM